MHAVIGLLVVLAVGYFTLPHFVVPAQTQPRTELEVRMDNALRWISTRYRLPYHPPPRVVWMSAEEMNRRSPLGYGSVGAMYNNGTVYFQPGHVSERLIVHEMVHHLQRMNRGREDWPSCRIELEAYGIEQVYERERGWHDAMPWPLIRHYERQCGR